MLGQLTLKLKQPITAERHLRQALQLRPGSLEAEVCLAEALEAQGKKDAASALLGEMLRQNPNQPYVLRALGRFLFRNGNLAEARERFQEALEWEPDSWALHVDLAMTALAQQQRQEAVSHLQEALRLEPGRSEVRAMLQEAQKNSHSD
jgi:predicted Zn-dependent protease